MAIAVAHATGLTVIGIDSSPAMLANAEAAASKAASTSICDKRTCVSSISMSRLG